MANSDREPKSPNGLDQSARFFTMAETYDRMCQSLVPQYDFIQNEVLAIPSIADENPTIIDLGGGSGILLEKALVSLSRREVLLDRLFGRFPEGCAAAAGTLRWASHVRDLAHRGGVGIAS